VWLRPKLFKGRNGNWIVIELDAVKLFYGQGPEVLKDVTFRMEAGEMRFLTGPSGAGKSSLLRILFLALRPTQGHFRLFGSDVERLSASGIPLLRRKMGVVFQDFRLLPHLSVFENVALPMRVIGHSESSYRLDVEELLDWVGLKPRMRDYPETLSGGEKQRVAIARAVVAKPKLLLADEPTGSVDSQMAKRLLRLFEELNKLGTTVLLATHDEKLIGRASLPVLRLESGTLSVAR
jgi:cell division transport system ATP-binding protein